MNLTFVVGARPFLDRLDEIRFVFLDGEPRGVFEQAANPLES